DNEPPSVHELQEGFTWLYLVLTADLLADLTLGAPCLVQLYQHKLGTWLNIKSGHQITVKEGDRVFLKSHDMKNCHDFDNHCKAGLASKVVHLHHNLVGEHTCMHKELNHRKGKSLEVQRQVLELTDESESELGRTQPSRSKSMTCAPSHQCNPQQNTAPHPLSPSWSPPATIQACKHKPSSEPAERCKDTHHQCALPQSPSLGS
ncbi:hypothetical protein L208DRAFT_1265437, partial [Tricholoma matsutake]